MTPINLVIPESLAAQKAELESALAEAFSADEPILIDVRTAAGLPFAPQMSSPVMTG